MDEDDVLGNVVAGLLASMAFAREGVRAPVTAEHRARCLQSWRECAAALRSTPSPLAVLAIRERGLRG